MSAQTIDKFDAAIGYDRMLSGETGTGALNQIRVENMLPTSISQQATTLFIRFYLPRPLTASENENNVIATDSNLRLTAPVGFLFTCSAKEHAGECVCDGTSLCIPNSLPPDCNDNVCKSFPTGGNAKAHKHVVTWERKQYLAEVQYGVDLVSRIPNSSPTASSNMFYLEFGYDGQRSYSYVQDAERVQSIANFAVDYSNNIAEQETFLTFSFEIVAQAPV